MRNDALSPHASAAPAVATGCGARFELALVAAFKGGGAAGMAGCLRPPPARP